MKIPPTLVVYGDFNCPFSALASYRATLLHAHGRAVIDWRSVEHAPQLPVEGREVQGDLRQGLGDELDQVHAQVAAGETFRLELPSWQRNTRLDNLTYAAADIAHRPRVRELIFASYWGVSATNLSGANPLEAVRGNPDDEAAVALVERWRDEWIATPRPVVPAMVLPGGHVSRGLGALRRLAKLLSDEAISDQDQGGEAPCFAHLIDDQSGRV